MVIHIGASEDADASKTVQQLVDKHNGKELRLSGRLIGWNLSDTIVIRNQGLSKGQIQKYVRHFAAQRHVVFEDRFPAADIDPYIMLARELRDYFFAFVDQPQRDQAALKQQFRSAACNVVTLRPTRSVQQVEVLLMSAPTVLGRHDPLVLPEAAARKTRASARRTENAA